MRRKLKTPVFFFFVFLFLLLFISIGKSAIYYETYSEKTEEQEGTTVSKEEFIKEIAPLAQNVQKAYGIRASIIIAQATLESNFGQSQLASKYNNLFGVKADKSHKHIKLETKEFENGKWITIKGDFVWYDSWQDSITSHARLMRAGVDWDKDKYAEVIAANDYKTAAQALQDAGYATDPDYADKLMAMIEQYKLYEYDEE